MAISTNSIVHYTKSLDNLLQILETGFSIKYCKEEFSGNDAVIRYAYPMVCFCDIPLSEVKQHLDSYGHYGIGLKKDWAIISGLNPVLYLEKNSFLTNTLMQQASRLDKDNKEGKTNPEAIRIDEIWRQELLTVSSFMKNYEGNLMINGKEIKNYRFYNEREWRYVPDKDILEENPRAIHLDKYVLDKEKYNSKVNKVKLEFKIPEDIAYIIVKEEEDIHKTLDFITQKFKKTLLALDIEILMTKIISTDQIINDF